MFYNENLSLNPQKNLEIKISDFSKGVNTSKSESVLPLEVATNAYNFNLNSGSLTQGLGLKQLTTPFVVFGQTYEKTYTAPQGVSNIKNLWVYNIYDYSNLNYIPTVLLFGDDQKLYLTNLQTSDGFVEIGSMQLSGQSVGTSYSINGNDCMLFAGAQTQNSIYSLVGVNTFACSTGCPSILSIAKYGGRLFATSFGSRKKLYFSDEIDPREWDVQSDDNYVEIVDERGSLNKLIEWNNYLYIIRDFGISRISSWNSKDDFVLRNVFLSTSRIYENTVAQCGDHIVFLCKDGLYQFDGNDANKLDLGLDAFFNGVDNENAAATYLDGKYYLACKLNFDDNAQIGCESSAYKNNVLLEYDLNTKQVQILRGVDIKLLLNLRVKGFSKLVCCLNSQNQQDLILEVTHSGAVLNTATKKYWKSSKTDFGYPAQNKILKEIFVTANKTISIKITTEKGTKVVEVAPSLVPRKCKLNLKAKTFSFAFSCEEAEVEILPPMLNLTVV